MFSSWNPKRNVYHFTFPFIQQPEFPDLVQNEPHRFQLTAAAAIFQSLLDSSPQVLEDLVFDKHQNWFVLESKHDELWWAACTKTQYFRRPSETGQSSDVWSSLQIKLPNNGFLYKPNQQMEVVSHNVERHNSSFYSALKLTEFNDPFLCLWTFLDKLFDGSDNWRVKFFYSRNDERIDMVVEDALLHKQVELYFEPLSPIQEIEDYWQKPTAAFSMEQF